MKSVSGHFLRRRLVKTSLQFRTLPVTIEHAGLKESAHDRPIRKSDQKDPQGGNGPAYRPSAMIANQKRRRTPHSSHG